jgi:hypothetical protein
MHQALSRLFATSFNDSSAVWNIIFRNRGAKLLNSIFLCPGFSFLAIHQESRDRISAIYESSLTIFAPLGVVRLEGVCNFKTKPG